MRASNCNTNTAFNPDLKLMLVDNTRHSGIALERPQKDCYIEISDFKLCGRFSGANSGIKMTHFQWDTGDEDNAVQLRVMISLGQGGLCSLSVLECGREGIDDFLWRFTIVGPAKCSRLWASFRYTGRCG